MSTPLRNDPFASTADPDSYVPRRAADAALEQLARGFDDRLLIQVLTGPPGIGKTMLMNVLARRLEARYRCLYLPYGSLPMSELCGWVLGLLGETPAPDADPESSLLAVALASQAAARPLLLMIDDASTMPEATAAALGALVEHGQGALRLLLVPVEDARTGRLLAALGHVAPEFRLSAPFGPQETARLVRTRLERAAAPPEVVERFTPDVVGMLHRLSGGIPRLLNQLADDVVRGNVDQLPGRQPVAHLSEPTPGEAELNGEILSETLPTAPGGEPEPRLASPGDPEALRTPPPAPIAIRGSEGSPKRMALVIAINLGLAVGALALLWLTGYFPPP